MGELIDLSGQKFGFLTVESKNVERTKACYWNCVCDCGNTTIVNTHDLRSGHTKSCGKCGLTHKKPADMTGMRFGRLVVIGLDHIHITPSGQTKRFWLCQCDCGNQKAVASQQLTGGGTQSCGCYRREYMSEHKSTHRLTNTRIYHIHQTMIARCEVPTSYRYKYYGAKGVTVCDEWHTFENFYTWATNNGYEETLTLDRIDVNKGYCPENCRWVSWTVQQNNKSNNHYIEYNGETHTVTEWERITGLPIGYRVNNGWDIERIFTQPKRVIHYGNNEQLHSVSCTQPLQPT